MVDPLGVTFALASWLSRTLARHLRTSLPEPSYREHHLPTAPQAATHSDSPPAPHAPSTNASRLLSHPQAQSTCDLQRRRRHSTRCSSRDHHRIRVHSSRCLLPNPANYHPRTLTQPHRLRLLLSRCEFLTVPPLRRHLSVTHVDPTRTRSAHSTLWQPDSPSSAARHHPSTVRLNSLESASMAAADARTLHRSQLATLPPPNCALANPTSSPHPHRLNK